MAEPHQGQPSRAKLNEVVPRFLVGDMKQALAFYGQLGFQTTYHEGGFAIVCRDDVDIHLNESDGPMTSHSVCWISVTNIDSLYQEYSPTNAVQSEPTGQPWGLKEFYLKDPWRNLILFGEPVDVDEAGHQYQSEHKDG